MRKGGYTLEQLLSWCVDDGLIDDFSSTGGQVEIRRGSKRSQLTRPAAIQFLKDLFRAESQSVGQSDPRIE